MTNNALRDQFVDQEENPALYNSSNGLPNSTASSANQSPFYVDSSGDLNFGYGFDLSKNGTTVSTRVSALASYLGSSISSVNQTLLLNQLTSYLNGTITLSQLNSSIPQINYQPVAQQVTDNYFAANVDNVLPGQLERYAGLTAAQVSTLQANSYAWAALEDLVYNASSAISGSKIPNLDNDLAKAVSTGNWGQVAYDIGFNTNTSVFNRREDESLLVLGFNSAGFAENLRTSISPLSSTSVNNTSVISYEQIVAKGTITPYAETQTALTSYLFSQGYYVPQSSDGGTPTAIAQSIANQLAATVSGLNLGTLLRLNAPFNDSSFTTGGLVHVPISALPMSAGSITSLPPLPVGQNYVFDAVNSTVYVTGGSTNSQYLGLGSALLFDQSSANNFSSFAQGTYSGLTVGANGDVTVNTTTPTGTALGTETFNPLSDTVHATISNGVTLFNVTIGSGTSAKVEDNYTVQSTLFAEQYTFSQSAALKIDAPSSFSGTLNGFAPSDTIDLAGIGTATSATLGAGNVLTVSGGSSNVTLNLNPAQNFRDDSFVVASDGNGGTNVTATSLVGVNSSNASLVNPQSGSVTALTASLGINGVNIGAEAAENGYLYLNGVVSGGARLFTINLSTGQFTSVASSATNYKADNLTGALVGITGSNIVTVNPTTGAITTIATISGLNGANLATEAAANGFLYFNGVSGSTTLLYSVNITTGQVTTAPSSTGVFVADNLTGDLVGVSGQNVVTINPTTGALTTIATIAGLNGVNIVAQAAENGVYYFNGNTSSGTHLFAVNIATGQVTSSTSAAGNFVADNSVTLTVAQFLANNAGITAGVSGFTIVDTAANIAASISQLNAAAAYIAAINPTDQAVALTASQVSQGSVVANVISGGITVVDTAANVATNIAALQAAAAAGKLTSITLMDSSTPTLTLTAAQNSADAAALAKISSAYNLSITGVSAANAATVASQTNVTSITVSDTAANVVANIASLETLATGTELTSITLTDSTTPTLSLTAAQDSADSAVLGKIISAYNLTVSNVLAANAASVATQTHFVSEAISDTAADFVSSITSLEALAKAGEITSIVFTDSTKPTISLTSAQQTADVDALNKIISSYNLVTITSSVSAATAATTTTVVAVSDTSANVLSFLPQLETQAAAGLISSIAFTDSTTPTLALTAAQLGADATVIGTITSTYNLSISGVTAANATTVASNAHVTSLTVSDTGANVVTSIAALETLATGTKLSSITLTDSSTPTLALTAVQYSADTVVLGKISSSYNLSISGVMAANAATVAGAAHVTSITVSDTAANVLTNISALETLATGTKLSSIVLTDSTTPTLALAAAQYSADSAALALIGSAYNLTVSGVTAANAATVAGNTHVTSLTVSDTGANVATNIGSLETLAIGTELSSITLTDSTTPTLALTFAQYSADTAALGKITSTYNLSISGVTAANAAAVAGNTHVTSFTVSDTGANVVSSIASLETLAMGTQLSSITLTDTSTPTLALTSAQYSADTAALGKITGTYNLSISGVTAANAVTIAGAAHVTSITVSDTAANVLANITALETVVTGTKLSSITLTDSTTPTLALTSTQDSADSAVLGKIISAYNLTVSNVLAVNAASVATQAHFVSEAISDTAADFVSSIASLETLAAAGEITSIAFTDSSTPTITLTSAQQTADAAALSKITSPYNLVIGSGSVTAAVAATATTVVAVSDTSANVLSFLSQLQTQAAAGRISSIAFTDSTTPTLALTAAQLTADATVLGTITSAYNLSISGVTAANAATVASQAHVTSISISDTSANVVTNIASLETLATGTKLSSIALTDSSTPTLSLSATQSGTDLAALTKITSAYNLSVSDTTVNVVANLAALQTLAASGKLTSITLTGSSSTLTITGVQLLADGTAIGKISSYHTLIVTGVSAANVAAAINTSGVTSITVSDTAANVAANLSTLESYAGGTGRLTSITLTDSSTPTLSLTASQLSSDSLALGIISSAYNLAITGVTAANASSVASQAHVTSISVSDASTNITNNLTALETLATGTKLSSIILTDSTTPTLSWTAAQVSTDAAVLGKISSAYNLSVSGVTAANATTVAGQAHVTSLTVSDTAANIVANLAALQTLATSGKLSSITSTDTSTFTITAAQLSADGTALGKISTTHSLIVTGVSAANVATVSNVSGVISFTVSDTAANIAANLSTLESYAGGSGRLTSISLTDSSTPTLSLTASQLSADSIALGKITNAYNLVVAGVTAANASSVAGQSHVISISVSDASTNIVNNITALETLATDGKLVSIILTDSPTPTLSMTSAQISANADVLAEILSAYNLSVSGVTAANAATVAGQSHVTSISVSDTAANVVANLAVLETLATGTELSSISLTDTSTLTITAAQLSADSAALGKISATHSLIVTGVSVANVSTVSNVSGVISFTVSDTAANVSANLNTLESYAGGSGRLTSISLTDSSTPTLSLAASQLTTDSIALGIITSAYNFALSGGGSVSMGSNLAHVQAVNLQSATSAYNFMANSDAGLVITDSSATNDTLTAGSGGDTLIAGTGNDTLNGGNAYNTYKFGATFGQDIINNASGGNTAVKGEIDFASGITDEKLWFAQSGSNLVVDLLGTTDQITISNWFGSNAGADVQTFNAGGLKLDTQVAQLVAAMASYGASNSAFNPQTATAMPTNTTLQNAIAAAWHS